MINVALKFIDIPALSPLLILFISALILLLLETFAEKFSKKFSIYFALGAVIIALIAAYFAPITDDPLLTAWLRFDSLARFFTLFFLMIGIATIFISFSFFKQFNVNPAEFLFLVISCLFGLILIGMAADFLILFLGLEILSISLYILCAYMKKWHTSQEAAIKYFLIGAIATAFLLYGIAFIYGALGTTQFGALLTGYRALSITSDRTLFLSGIAFVTLGLAFKAAIVPFHIWAPDVYEGAATPVTAFMAVGTKVGAFAAFAILFFKFLPQFDPIWNQALALLAYSTLIYANFVALRQVQLRRFFAYSGISQAGFLLIPLVVGTEEALSALLFYLVVYALATFGSFAVLILIDHRKEGVLIQDLQGFFQRSPLLASFFILCLLTLAGIPPTIGFFAKFYVFKLAFQAGYHGLVIVGLLTTLLSIFYYLRIIGIMLLQTSEEKPVINFFKTALIVGFICVGTILILSIYPIPLMHLIAL